MGDKKKETLIFRGGCDLSIGSELQEFMSCIQAKYDSSIVNHKGERTGIIEIYIVEKDDE